ncbi:hypothetical protein [Halorhodospira halophila]|uniref:hypothetical protein n=1 Tax=Halorhodospira halophila TaxID=1053 RepID=UPI0002D30DD0|nr:hypothetical protein [Halorhodospira halophila]MBK1728213.1 hypothetical protein [Halorhodospira halophila]
MVRASGGPLRDAKIELGVVVLLVVAVYFLTLGLDIAAWQEVVGVLAAACLGGGWVALRVRVLARRRLAEGREHGNL